VRKLLAYLTDFGLRDPYVGMMKAVAESICPGIRIIDITHGVPKYNVVLGSHILRISRRFFPRGTVYVGVVDPGVGSERRAIAIITEGGNAYVGPDNGLLTPSAFEEGVREVYELIPEKAGLRKISHTFHGRDLFTPAAALISCGVDPSYLGKPLRPEELVMGVKLPKVLGVLKGSVTAEVVYADDFGNIVTSADIKGIQNALGVGLGGLVQVSPDGAKWVDARIVKSFSQVCKGCLAIYEGSYELAEVGVNQGSAYRELRPGDKVFFRRPPK